MPLPEQAVQDIHKIREVLENYSDKERQNVTKVGGLKGFSAGYCGFCSELIGLLLLNEYGLTARYVTGEGGHSWVEYQGYIIDITVDQFKNRFPNLPKVLIAKESKFHEKLKRIEPNRLMTVNSFSESQNVVSALNKILKEIR